MYPFLKIYFSKVPFKIITIIISLQGVIALIKKYFGTILFLGFFESFFFLKVIEKKNKGRDMMFYIFFSHCIKDDQVYCSCQWLFNYCAIMTFTFENIDAVQILFQNIWAFSLLLILSVLIMLWVHWINVSFINIEEQW